MELDKLIIIVFTILASVVGAWVTVRVSIAELKKDKNFSAEKLDEHKTTISEVKGDIKGIYKLLTIIQVDLARTNGRDEVLKTVRNTLETLAKQKNE